METILDSSKRHLSKFMEAPNDCKELCIILSLWVKREGYLRALVTVEYKVRNIKGIALISYC